jgi:hypothetical protein
MSFVRCVSALVACCLILLPAGCTKRPPASEAMPSHSLLNDVSEMLQAASGVLGRPAANLNDLNGAPRDTHTRGYNAVKSGDVVVLWGARLQGEGDVGKNETVVAYEKNVPTSGGFVLLSAGTVKHMTPDEFKAAPKGGK